MLTQNWTFGVCMNEWWTVVYDYISVSMAVGWSFYFSFFLFIYLYLNVLYTSGKISWRCKKDYVFVSAGVLGASCFLSPSLSLFHVCSVVESRKQIVTTFHESERWYATVTLHYYKFEYKVYFHPHLFNTFWWMHFYRHPIGYTFKCEKVYTLKLFNENFFTPYIRYMHL